MTEAVGWIRATYQPRDASALTEHQRERIGARALFRPSRFRPTFDTPAAWRSIITVEAADLADAEGVGEDEGWRSGGPTSQHREPSHD